jgi:hypothetical protein
LVNCITSIIQPTTWDDVGGPGSIAPLASQQLLVIRQTRDVQEEVANFLDTMRHRVETRPQIRIEAHWLWLTEPELASLLTDQDHASPSVGDVVAEAAWKTLRQQKRRAGDSAARAFEAILKCQDGQLIGGTSGRQTRVLIKVIPVFGDPPATVAPPASAPETPAADDATPKSATPPTPAPTVQTVVLPPAAGTYPPQRSAVGYQSVCHTIQEGGALEVRPCIVAEGKEILMDLRSRFVQREDSPDGKPQTPAALGRSSANMVQALAEAVDRPQIHHYRLETTLRLPAGRRVLVGGLTYGKPSADESNLYLFVKASVVPGPGERNH